MDINEIEQAVNSIAHDIFNSCEAEYLSVQLRTNGYVHIVDFEGIHLWDSEMDDREYIDEQNDIREPIENHLRRRLREELRVLARIEV